MKFVCSEKGKKSRVHFPACCYTTKTRPKARKENIMPDQNHIVIQGLCQNNLKNISLKIPKQKLVVFTGVSGSGKSSIVFDTIAAESQRQMNETYSAYVRGRLPKYKKPKAEIFPLFCPKCKRESLINAVNLQVTLCIDKIG